jgi:hypothetical protein
MKSVYKYSLTYEDCVVVAMPVGAEILHFGIQGNTPAVWALVDRDEKGTDDRVLCLAGTGHDIPEEIIAHIGSVTDPLSLVWHLFEVR